MKKFLLYFSIEKKFKHLQISKFHTEAKNREEALENLKKQAYFNYKVIGIANGIDQNFQNNLFE